MDPLRPTPRVSVHRMGVPVDWARCVSRTRWEGVLQREVHDVVGGRTRQRRIEDRRARVLPPRWTSGAEHSEQAQGVEIERIGEGSVRGDGARDRASSAAISKARGAAAKSWGSCGSRSRMSSGSRGSVAGHGARSPARCTSDDRMRASTTTTKSSVSFMLRARATTWLCATSATMARYVTKRSGSLSTRAAMASTPARGMSSICSRGAPYRSPRSCTMKSGNRTPRRARSRHHRAERTTSIGAPDRTAARSSPPRGPTMAGSRSSVEGTGTRGEAARFVQPAVTATCPARQACRRDSLR